MWYLDIEKQKFFKIAFFVVIKGYDFSLIVDAQQK